MLELGSLASAWATSEAGRSATEAVVRQILALRPRPVIVFVTVALWVYAPDINKKPRCKVQQSLMGGNVKTWLGANASDNKESSTPQGLADAFLYEMCRHYGLSCLSLLNAFGEQVRAGTRGFRLDDVASDCLHPHMGKHGSTYVADLLVHWLWTSTLAVRAEGSVLRFQPAVTAALPTPLVGASSEMANVSRHLKKGMPKSLKAGACYEFRRDGLHAERVRRAGKWSNSLPWRTAWCGADGRRCSDWNLEHACPSSLTAVRTDTPPAWIFCDVSLDAKRTPSRGLVAFRPGSTLRLQVPVHTREDSSTTAASTTQEQSGGMMHIDLIHLTSHEHMGIVLARCALGCTCEERQIDAHRRAVIRRETILLTHTVHATALDGASLCTLELRLLNRTSSGEHQFKLAEVHVTT